MAGHHPLLINWRSLTKSRHIVTNPVVGERIGDLAPIEITHGVNSLYQDSAAWGYIEPTS